MQREKPEHLGEEIKYHKSRRGTGTNAAPGSRKSRGVGRGGNEVEVVDVEEEGDRK